MANPTEPKLPESLEVVAWATTSTKDGKQMLLEPCVTTNAVYMRAHSQWDWKPHAFSIAAHESALKARDAEIERLRGDAERYRWLRDEAHPDRDDTGISVSEADFNDWGNRFTRYFSGNALDAAIDQARATGGEKAK